MFLKSLSLKGFKSFADPTTLDLEPGVTVVVGPNGSGKSNVVDAIAWVLGAQAPTAVRSGKMDDVIFAGTAERPALGRAEVSLTIDNSSGVLPVELSEVKITRTLFRTGDSEYSINGAPCRLLDIAELLSDGGVGRQQHVIVSQGQIDTVLNARPEDRRAIIEEAAGVLKYRKRKERAQRRLTASDADMTRVKDLMREVRRQLRPLERQAEAARRHGDLVDELTALRTHLLGREILELRSALAASRDQRRQREETERELRTEIEHLTEQVSADEHTLAERGAQDLGDELARLEALRQRADGRRALIDERRGNLERERARLADRALIASLQAEATRCRADLDTVEREADELAPEQQRLAELEAQLESDRAMFAEEWGDGVPVPDSRAAEVRGELGALRSSIERGGAERTRLEQRQAEIDGRRNELETAAARHRDELAAVHVREEALVADLEQAEAEAAAVAAEVEALQVAVVDAEADHHRWVARFEALELAIDEARTRAGAERVAEVEGVIGVLLELVAVDPGWEKAFSAAAAPVLGAIVVGDRAAAKRVVGALVSQDTGGAVVALGVPVTTAPRGPGAPIRDHVRGTVPGVDDLLDALVGDVTVLDGDWRQAADASAAHPGAVIVTKTGDRFAPDGWRVGTDAASATGAALAEAEAEVSRTLAATERAHDDLARARDRHHQAVAAVQAAATAVDELDERHTAAAEALQLIEGDRREVDAETEGLGARIAELAKRQDRETERLAALEKQLPALETGEAQLLERGRRLASVRAEIEERAREVGAMRTDLGVRAAALEERRTGLDARLAELEGRLDRDAAEVASEKEHEARIDRTIAVLDRAATIVAAVAARVEQRLSVVRAERQRQSDEVKALTARLDDNRRRRADSTTTLDSLRARAGQADVEEAEQRTRLQALVERARTEQGLDPEAAIAAPCPPPVEDGGPGDPVERLRLLEHELDIMGPVNPLALEEYRALSERHDFLQSQLDDIKGTRRELMKVIRSIDEEIMSVFAAAFADVSANFEHLFETLFPGGQGRIALTQPDNLLETGVEIEARPSGKNVRKLSLLSGGERSLTALAFLFAVFRSRPSPFYVMDEVEAALDDINLHRFLSLVDEFRSEAQLLLVSHQKRTMEAADCLYGVSMRSGGSSRVISEKVTSAA